MLSVTCWFVLFIVMGVCFVAKWMLSTIAWFGVNDLVWLVLGISCAWVLVNGVNDGVLEILYAWFVVLSFVMMVFGVVNGLYVAFFL